MNKKIIYTLLTGIVFFPAFSAGASCLPKATTIETDLGAAFEPFYPGKGSFYAQRLYLANDPRFQKEISQNFRQCAVHSHPDKSDDDSAADRMTACNNAVEYLEAHFQCLDQDPTYGILLHALRQAQLGSITQREVDFLFRIHAINNPEATAIMAKWKAETLSQQIQQNIFAALSKEMRLEKEQAEQEKEQQRSAHKSRVRGGARAA